MGKFGCTAVAAAALIRSGGHTAEDAWRAVAAETFLDAPESRRKVCPKETFLGLCEGGVLRGISSSACGASASKNRQYGMTAATILAQEPGWTQRTKQELWSEVLERLQADPTKRHNQQMDVVLSLWEAGELNLSVLPAGNGGTHA